MLDIATGIPYNSSVRGIRTVSHSITSRKRSKTMAQPMTGRDSTPRAISDAPISIFAKEEKKMTRKPAAETTEQVVETTATVEPTPVQSVASDDLAYLVAQRKALSEQIKAAKVAAKAAKAQP